MNFKCPTFYLVNNSDFFNWGVFHKEFGRIPFSGELWHAPGVKIKSNSFILFVVFIVKHMTKL
jgi:hypothetical protein